ITVSPDGEYVYVITDRWPLMLIRNKNDGSLKNSPCIIRWCWSRGWWNNSAQMKFSDDGQLAYVVIKLDSKYQHDFLAVYEPNKETGILLDTDINSQGSRGVENIQNFAIYNTLSGKTQIFVASDGATIGGGGIAIFEYDNATKKLTQL